ncbi:RutC family protein [Zancudomyces culisetae]|uniref:RutC family protein n=1 Tax=Zancudomyces culisetae TaxID=1213189 RepID=A0A1R1PDR8_ZANCU|nr:RutC family protein [Zancudomyces culisetae]|eukprot:OMH79069.1 RutC family protein [Zancudomyces culisetae]
MCMLARAIVSGGTVYVSGQLPVDSKTNEFVNGDITLQTKIVLENVKEILEAAGSSMDKVVKTTVLLTDINEWPAMNEEYAKHFTKPYPARVAYQVVNLPKGAKVEIDCIATV